MYLALMEKTDLEAQKKQLLQKAIHCRIFNGRWPIDFCLKRIEAAKENPDDDAPYNPCPTCLEIKRILKIQKRK